MQTMRLPFLGRPRSQRPVRPVAVNLEEARDVAYWARRSYRETRRRSIVVFVFSAITLAASGFTTFVSSRGVERYGRLFAAASRQMKRDAAQMQADDVIIRQQQAWIGRLAPMAMRAQACGE